MNTRFIYVIVALIFMSITQSFGQKAIKLVTGQSVIDCSDMPVYSIVKVKKLRTTAHKNGRTPLGGSGGLDDLGSLRSDERVYMRFEVQKTENPRKNWEEAFLYCKEIQLDGVRGWRLPTFRELMLVHIFHESLVTLGGFTKLYNKDAGGGGTNAYWSATTFVPSTPSVGTFGVSKAVSAGGFEVVSRDKELRFRCIRDLDL